MKTPDCFATQCGKTGHFLDFILILPAFRLSFSTSRVCWFSGSFPRAASSSPPLLGGALWRFASRAPIGLSNLVRLSSLEAKGKGTDSSLHAHTLATHSHAAPPYPSLQDQPFISQVRAELTGITSWLIMNPLLHSPLSSLLPAEATESFLLQFPVISPTALKMFLP